MSADHHQPSVDETGTSPDVLLEIAGVSKRFGNVMAVDDVALAVSRGEFLTILGPSGSGKTTLLKLVAGFEWPDTGTIGIGGEDVTELDPGRRNIGMVFQNYALFPHMTVARNIGYPLAMRGVSRGEIGRRVDEALALVELPDYGARMPRQLSGGQQQRVALARAIVFQPRLLLLDEPFGALDRKLREQMQLEVRRLQQRLGLTTLFITHDQEEALVMSDRIAVMDKGRLLQVGKPEEIYESPANIFIADFVGESNLLTGVLETDGTGLRLRLESGSAIMLDPEPGLAAKSGRTARVLIRPERFVDLDGVPADAPFNRITGEVREMAYTGISDKYRVATGGHDLLVRLPSGPGRRRFRPGESIALGFAPSDVRVVEVA